MKNMAELIAQQLETMLEQSPDGVIEIQRGALASQFACVPSQVTYVLATRFTQERGYLVESKRGGGGYIRVVKLPLDPRNALPKIIHAIAAGPLTQAQAEGYIQWLYREHLLTRREAMMLLAAVDRNVLELPVDLRDTMRSRLLSAMLMALMRAD